MTEYASLYVLKILHIIHHRLSVDSLLELGLEYSQITKLLSEALENGLIEDKDEEGLNLTETGIGVMNKLNSEFYPDNHQTWVLPSEENRIPKIDKFDIYLPRKQREE